MGKVRVKNVSRFTYDINLEFVKEGRVVNLKPNATYIMSEDEYDYLVEQCRSVFSNGILKVVGMDEDVTAEKVETENEMSDKDIKNLIDLDYKGFKTKISSITSAMLLGDIYREAVLSNKDAKYLKVIEEQIKTTGNQSAVL